MNTAVTIVWAVFIMLIGHELTAMKISNKPKQIKKILAPGTRDISECSFYTKAAVLELANSLLGAANESDCDEFEFTE